MGDSNQRATLFFLCLLCIWPYAVPAIMLDNIRLPEGFEISVFARDVVNARQLALGPAGIVFVGSREAGTVYRITDKDGDWQADSVEQIASGLYMPSGVAYRDGVLYIAEVHQISAIDNAANASLDVLNKRVVYRELPKDSHHGWKAIDFGPQGNLYVPVGAPCNVCDVAPPYASILKIDLEQNRSQIYARGIRNSVGFAWHPKTEQLWFSDNGRDWMGDDKPGCEINRVTVAGQHFGFPYIHANGIADDQFVAPSGLEMIPPAKVLDAHVAPLGMLFYTGGQFPASYKHRLLVAQHGSWNRTRKAGYNIMMADLNEHGKVIGFEVFAEGWLKGQAHWGRPVDIEMLGDGSLLVSDDFANVIYRIRYNGGH